MIVEHMTGRLVLMLALLVPACDDGPTQPSALGPTLEGAWVGSATDANGTRQLRLDFLESFECQTDVSGFVTIQECQTDVSSLLTIQIPDTLPPRLGTMLGLLSGTTLTFTWTIPSDCSPFGPACDLVATGSAAVGDASMSGSYRCTADWGMSTDC